MSGSALDQLDTRQKTKTNIDEVDSILRAQYKDTQKIQNPKIRSNTAHVTHSH